MKGALTDKIAIVGMGCTKFGENWDKSLFDMIVDAAYEAYQDAGVEVKDIQAAWFGNLYETCGGAWLADALKLDGKPITRVENYCATAMDALRNACFAVACGMYDLVLALGAEKLKDSGYVGLATAGMRGHPVLGWGLTAPGSFALAATRHFARFGTTKEHLAKIAVKNHHNGTLCPKAHFQRAVTLEQVMNAPMIAWPLGLFDCCPVTDGAAAAIITRADLARKFTDEPIYIKAIGMSVDAGKPFLRPGFDYLHWPATVNAGLSAYQQAGIKNPLEEIDVAQVHDCFTITELLNYEDLGFCPKGEGKDYVDAGIFTLEGKLPVNTDGGLKSFGHPVGASGLRMIYELYNQLRGKAGARQVKDATRGLAHNLGGTPQICSVTIVGKELG
jgi:acetyl-CoA C-acetyltransferase